MKKLIYILFLFFLVSCGSLKKDALTLKKNINSVQKKYPNSIVTQHRYFSYIFRVDREKNSIFVIIDNEGKIKITKEIK